MALWKASGGKFKLDFSPWHGGRQGGNSNKELEFRSGIVEGKGGTEEFDLNSNSLFQFHPPAFHNAMI